jgi:hypothetical protein
MSDHKDVAAPADKFVDDGSTGVEVEDTSGIEAITDPFDPTLIRISTRTSIVDMLLKRIKQNVLDLSPGFQRKAGLWSDEDQSRLIESLLIRIPIPAFYVDATDEDRWLVVDGLQRLTALRRFVLDSELSLEGLEFLTQFNGNKFESLPARYQRRIVETEVTIFMIEQGTPANVKFNIFKRINTTGLPLSGQEIRHALNQGRAPLFLAKLANSAAFLQATDHGIRDKRMADQEIVLRFLAFLMTPYTQYPSGELDGFLNEAMAALNKAPDTTLNILRDQFVVAMETAYAVFDRDAFRKRYSSTAMRKPINKALFEAWGVSLSRLDIGERQTLVRNKSSIIEQFIQLMSDHDFDTAISSGTGNAGKVRPRFEGVQSIINRVLAK